jgi:hypothetical protein
LPGNISQKLILRFVKYPLDFFCYETYNPGSLGGCLEQKDNRTPVGQSNPGSRSRPHRGFRLSPDHGNRQPGGGQVQDRPRHVS